MEKPSTKKLQVFRAILNYGILGAPPSHIYIYRERERDSIAIPAQGARQETHLCAHIVPLSLSLSLSLSLYIYICMCRRTKNYPFICAAGRKGDDIFFTIVSRSWLDGSL